MRSLGMVMIGGLLALSLLTGHRAGSDKGFRQPSVHQVAEIFQRFESIPKGFAVEGGVQGWPAITSATFDRAQGRLRINEKWDYWLPVSVDEFQVLVRALSEDDRLGVSLALDKSMMTYGKLPKKTQLAQDLLAADVLVRDVIFAQGQIAQGRQLPQNYQPKRVARRKGVSVVFTVLKSIQFGRIGDRLHRKGVDLTVQIIPVLKKAAANGGYLPDNEAIRAGRQAAEDQANLHHLLAYRKEYLQEKELVRATAIAEAAAVIRTLRDQKVDLSGWMASEKPMRKGWFRRR